VQDDDEQGAHDGLVSYGECSLLLQGLNEAQEDLAIAEEVTEVRQSSLHGLLSELRHLEQKRGEYEGDNGVGL